MIRMWFFVDRVAKQSERENEKMCNKRVTIDLTLSAVAGFLTLILTILHLPLLHSSCR
jgi:hypothetical protein